MYGAGISVKRKVSLYYGQGLEQCTRFLVRCTVVSKVGYTTGHQFSVSGLLYLLVSKVRYTASSQVWLSRGDTDCRLDDVGFQGQIHDVGMGMIEVPSGSGHGQEHSPDRSPVASVEVAQE